MRLKVTYNEETPTELADNVETAPATEVEGLMTHKDNVLMILRLDDGRNLMLGWDNVVSIHRVQKNTMVKISLDSFRKGRGNG